MFKFAFAVALATSSLLLQDGTGGDSGELPGPGEAYWNALEQGASEAEAQRAMRLAAGAAQLKDATHAGPIYWALVEMGATHDEAEHVMQLSSPHDQEELDTWRIALKELLIDMGLNEAESESIIPDVQLLSAEGDECWVYPVKIIWCEGTWKRRNNDYYINGNCWEEFIQQCFLQTCEEGEFLWYFVTLSDTCLSFLPSGSTCVSMRPTTGTWVKCDNPNLFSCDCIAEEDCSDVEKECCHHLNSCDGCPDCD